MSDIQTLLQHFPSDSKVGTLTFRSRKNYTKTIVVVLDNELFSELETKNPKLQCDMGFVGHGTYVSVHKMWKSAFSNNLPATIDGKVFVFKTMSDFISKFGDDSD